MQSDFVQFMQLGPLPGTQLYKDYESQDLLRFDIPFEDWHGQDKIWFKHEHFDRDETAAYTRRAFQIDYERQGPSLLRIADTSLRGYRTMRTHQDERIRGLTDRMKKRCLDLYALFPASRQSAENAKTHELLDYLEKEYAKEFGPPSILTSIASFVLSCFAFVQRRQLKDPTFMYQPPTVYTEYNSKANSNSDSPDKVLQEKTRATQSELERCVSAADEIEEEKRERETVATI